MKLDFLWKDHEFYFGGKMNKIKFLKLSSAYYLITLNNQTVGSISKGRDEQGIFWSLVPDTWLKDDDLFLFSYIDTLSLQKSWCLLRDAKREIKNDLLRLETIRNNDI